MPEYRLHCFAQSGNSYKPALMLALCGAEWEPVFVDYFKGASRAPEFRTVNEMGEVPVLDHGSLRLTQSGVILDYLAQTLGRFGPEDADERREILRWILWDNHKLTGYMATYRFMRTFTPSPDEHVLKHFRRRLDDFLSILEQHLKVNAFAIGTRPTIADISMMAYLHYPADETGYDLAASHPAIYAWLGRMAQLPGWRSAYDLLPGKRMTHYAK
jgi:glutathione S-transferase